MHYGIRNDDRRSRSFQGANVPGWLVRDNYTCTLTNLDSSALKRLRTPTNQLLALLFNNAIGPEQEPMRAHLLQIFKCDF